MTRMRLLALFAGLVGAGGVTGGLGAQCQPETPRGRELVMALATSPGSGSRPPGVPVVAADQVRLLTNASDAGTCQQLFHVFMGQRRDPETAPVGWAWSYYQVGDLYYVVAHRTTPAVSQSGGTLRVRLGWSPIIVVDRAYNVLATVGR